MGNIHATVRQDYRESHQGKGWEYHHTFSGSSYRAMLWRLERLALDEILLSHPHGTKLRHLDFACGTGRVLAHLQQKVTESVGIDISASMLEVARSVAPHARFYVGDITSDPILGGERFDLITAFRFFPKAQPLLRHSVMEQLRSALAPGGWLILNNHTNHSSLTRRLLGVPRSTMRHEEVVALAEQHGLRIRSIHHLGVLPVVVGRSWFPYWILYPVERALSRVQRLRYLGSDLLYVLESEVG